VEVPAEYRQYIFTDRVLFVHPPAITDSFTLYVKTSILLGKVKSFNIRFRIRYAEAAAHKDPRDTPEFNILDHLIKKTLENIPREHRDVFASGRLDPILYTVHLLPYAAMILLHDPIAEIGAPNCVSANRLLMAARAIMDLMYMLSATAYDLLYLDHNASFVWFLAGVVLTRFRAYNIGAGNETEVARMTQEIEVCRTMLGNMGVRTFIGLRQLNLLDEIHKAEMFRLHSGAGPEAAWVDEM